MNGYQGQLRASDQLNQSFPANQNLVPLIANNCKYSNFKIFKIGITTNNPFQVVFLNNNPFYFGSTHQLQFDDVDITSIYFAENTKSNVIIDYILQNRDG